MSSATKGSVERTSGWLIRSRRLARASEGWPSGREALIPIAAIRLCFTRLTPFRCYDTLLDCRLLYKQKGELSGCGKKRGG